MVYTGIYFHHSQHTLSGIRTTGSISGFPTVRGTAGTGVFGEYFTRKCCGISRFDTLGSILWIHSEYSIICPSVIPLTHSQYSQYFGRQYYCSTLSTCSTTCTRSSEHTRNICDAGCCSCFCCCCCCCPSCASAVDVPPSPAASEKAPTMLTRYSTAYLLDSTLYNKQQYYSCTHDTVNTIM